MSNTSKRSRSKRVKSMKGIKGTVGAPKKAVRWPNRPFTYEVAGTRNQNVSSLTIRNRVTDALKSGELVQLESRPQPHKGSGAPIHIFILKSLYNPARMKLADKAIQAKVDYINGLELPPAPTSPAPIVIRRGPPIIQSATPQVATPVPSESVAN